MLSEEQLYNTQPAFLAQLWLQLLVSPLLLICGSCGNALAIWGLWGGRTTSSTYVYLMVISVADQVILITGLGRKWLTAVSGYRPEAESTGICVATHFVLTCASFLSAFCLATVAMERLAIVWPCALLQRVIGKTNRCLLALLAVCLCLNAHWLLMLEATSYDLGDNRTHAECDIREEFLNYRPLLAWCDFALYSLLPVLVLLICTCAVLYRLFTSRRLYEEAPTSTLASASQQRTRSIRQVTVMLLTVCLFFIAASLPITSLEVLTSLKPDLADAHDAASYSRYRLLDTSAKLLMYANHSANFYLYCLSSRRFRRGLAAKRSRIARQLQHLFRCTSY